MCKVMKTFSAILFLMIGYSAEAQNYSIVLSAPQFDTGVAYLTYYYGSNMNIQDSGTINERGMVDFHSDKELPPGVYSIVFPGKRFYYDFLVGNEKQITVSVPDTLNLFKGTKVDGSVENKLFDIYQQFIAEKAPMLQQEREAYQKSTTAKDSTFHENNYRLLTSELNQFRDTLVKEHPGSMVAALLMAMKEPTVPHTAPKTKLDSLENYQYFKKHYWDNITFRDDRIIRTPFFLPKLERYFRQVIDPNADSVIREADYLLLLSRTSPGMYKFLLNWLTDEYYQPKYMGQDKVFVHFFEKYHSKGVSSWLNEKQLKSITDRAYMLMGNLIGAPAGPMVMTDRNGKETSLYNIKAAFTVVVFWDPNCGHCQKELPRVDSFYRARWKAEGVRIFTVLTDNDAMDKWKQFIDDHKLNDWTNVYESSAQSKAVEKAGRASYRQLYNVIETPTVFLLDSEKRIIAKKLTLEQFDEVIKSRLKSTSER